MGNNVSNLECTPSNTLNHNLLLPLEDVLLRNSSSEKISSQLEPPTISNRLPTSLSAWSRNGVCLRRLASSLSPLLKKVDHSWDVPWDNVEHNGEARLWEMLTQRLSVL